MLLHLRCAREDRSQRYQDEQTDEEHLDAAVDAGAVDGWTFGVARGVGFALAALKALA